MARGVIFKLFLTSLLLAVIASTAFSARKAPVRLQYNPVINQIVDYALDGGLTDPRSNSSSTNPDRYPGATLGVSTTSASPGAELGKTMWEYQANNYQGRMIRTGRNFDAGLNDSLTLVHFEWTNANSAATLETEHGPAYAYYDASSGAYQAEVNFSFDPQRGRFFFMEVTKANQAIICGQMTDDGSRAGFSPRVYYDNGPGDQGFGMIATVDTALWIYANPYTGEGRNAHWAHVAFQERPTGQHITHVTAQLWNGGAAGHVMYYFRKEGNTAALNLGQLSSCPSLAVTGWDCPFVVDTLHSTSAGVEASKQSGKVALLWNANLPDYTLTPGCDTCSVNASLGATRDRFENDMYYQVSTNYGVSWGPMKNVTKNDALTADWMPWSDVDGMWDINDKFHLAWVASDWKRYRTETVIAYGSRIFHWMEDFGLSTLNGNTTRTVMQRNEDPVKCNAGAFNQNLSKISMGECNTNLYIVAVDLWEGHDDPLNPDCSKRGLDGDFTGSVNGELVVAISDDNGVAWDLPHNLTNSPTPGCDSVGGIVGPCHSDHYPSMIPRGIFTRTGDDWTAATKVNPRPAQSYPDVVGAEWLDVQYIDDMDAGTSLYDNSTIRDNPLRHFRMACVDPDQVPVPVYSISEINWPTFVKPGQQKDISVLVENIGNSPTTMSVLTEEDTGPTGWLTVNGFAASIGEGTNNKDTGNIHLSAVGLTADKVNQAGGTAVVFGRVRFDHQGPSDVGTVPVTLIVTDTIRLPNWDTIHTGVISLAIATNGQFGGGGDAGMSNVRLDFYDDPLECDKDTLGAKLGDTRYYLYDGSFAVGGIVGVDTIMANQIFNQGTRELSSVYQTASHAAPATSGVLSTWNSGKLVNHDSSLAFNVRWVAPQVTQTWGTATGKTWHADQNFVTRELKIWPNKGVAVTGLAIGDAIDWDIPADSGSDNKGEVDATKRLIYLKGGEYNQDNATECQNNDTRYGGMAYGFLRAYWNHDNNAGTPKRWTVRDSVGYGGYAEANARYVYPGWKAGELYANMEGAVGYIPWTHTPPDSQQTDLHAVLTAAFNYDVAVGDTVAIYTVYSSVRNDASVGSDRVKDLATKGRNFTYYFTCCNGTRGDLNGDGAESNVLDLTFAVDRIFRGQPPSACPGEADVNRDKSVLDVVDMTFLVDRIFRGGAAPAACSVAPTI